MPDCKAAAIKAPDGSAGGLGNPPEGLPTKRAGAAPHGALVAPPSTTGAPDYGDLEIGHADAARASASGDAESSSTGVDGAAWPVERRACLGLDGDDFTVPRSGAQPRSGRRAHAIRSVVEPAALSELSMPRGGAGKHHGNPHLRRER